jgi:hypothetical protein
MNKINIINFIHFYLLNLFDKKIHFKSKEH